MILIEVCYFFKRDLGLDGSYLPRFLHDLTTRLQHFDDE